MYGDHEGRAEEHDEDEEAEHFVFVHHPEEDGEELEEGEGVDELVAEYTAELAYGYFEYVVFVVLLEFWVCECVGEYVGEWFVFCFGF